MLFSLLTNSNFNFLYVIMKANFIAIISIFEIKSILNKRIQRLLTIFNERDNDNEHYNSQNDFDNKTFNEKDLKND